MSKVKDLKCLLPWSSLEIFQDGSVYFCCPAFSKKQLGNINKNSLLEIWNSKSAQKIRENLINNNFEKSCKVNCPRLVDNKFFIFKDIQFFNKKGKTNKFLNNLILKEKEIKRKDLVLKSMPLRINLSNWMLCNLNCKMCFSQKHNQVIPNHVKKLNKELPIFLPYLNEIILSGAGEPFLRPDAFNLMKNYDSNLFPHLNFAVITNGTLLNKKWKFVSHCNFNWFNISIDAASEKTYKKIRKGGDWNELQKSLKLLSKLKTNKKFEVQISMVVMRSNYHEIHDFVKMGKKYGFFVTLSKVRGNISDNENIFTSSLNKTIEPELRKIFSHSIMKDVRMPEFFNLLDKKHEH